MPSVTGSPFDDEPVLRSTSVKFSLSAPSAKPLPVANRFDVPSIKDLSLFFPPFLRLYLCVPSHSTLSKILSASSFSISLSLRREEKCPEIFCLLSFTNSRWFSCTLDTDFGESVFSVRNRFSRNSVIKPVVYGQNSFARTLNTLIF